MAYDQAAYKAWEQQFPDATDEDKRLVKDMYKTDDKPEDEKAKGPSVTTK